MKVAAGYYCSGADFERANAGYWAELLFGWVGELYGGSELGKKVKELEGKPGLVNSRCKRLRGLCCRGFRVYAGGV